MPNQKLYIRQGSILMCQCGWVPVSTFHNTLTDDVTAMNCSRYKIFIKKAARCPKKILGLLAYV